MERPHKTLLPPRMPRSEGKSNARFNTYDDGSMLIASGPDDAGPWDSEYVYLSAKQVVWLRDQFNAGTITLKGDTNVR